MIKNKFHLVLNLFAAVFLFNTAMAQVEPSSDLYRTIKTRDSLLFNVGFNTCNIPEFENLVSEDFEFYHDQAGMMLSKEAFVKSFTNNVCGLNYKARRALVEGTMEVYPLKKNGVLYGAIQTGIHRFYALEQGKPEYFTGSARFSSVWKLNDGVWKFQRGLSFDHQEKDLVTKTLNFGNAADIDVWLKEKKIPALAIGIIRNGKLQEIRAYGVLDKGRPAPYNAIFNVASITKTIVTMLTLKLVDARKWNLDEPLYKYWVDPDVKNDERSKRITTRNVLTHKTGFPNWRWQNKTGKLAFEHDPGTVYEYSGEGLEYLRHALENKFHKPLNQLADELILKPLGMNDTHFIWDNTIDESRFAVPHDASGNALPYENNTKASAADPVKTTIADYGKFLIWTMNGAGLSKPIFDEMISHQTETKANRYIGLGWFVYDHLGDGEYALSHGGDDPGAHTIAFLFPKSKQGIIIFTNSDNGPQAYSELLLFFLKEKGQAIVDIELK